MGTMNPRRERLYTYGWAVVQALPWWLALGGLTWVGYGWPLPLPPLWREGLTLGLLLSYAWWRVRRPWNWGLLALLAWCMGSVWTLYPAPSAAFWGTAILVACGLSFLWAFFVPGPGLAGKMALFLIWAVYMGFWLAGLGMRGILSHGWFMGLGVLFFFLFLVEGWQVLGSRSIVGVLPAAGDLYVACSILVWILYIWSLTW